MAGTEDPPPGPSSLEVTRILGELGARPEAAEELLPLLYGELRALARHRLAGERPGHSLEATALVHEAWLRLAGESAPDWESRIHFFRVASEAMRRVLIDHARRRRREKRGGGRARVALAPELFSFEADPEPLLAVDEALTKLEAEDPRAAEVVRLRFFAGLEVSETAELLGASPRTVMREWAFARARLTRLLGAPAEDEPEGA